jgi:hypothetical protein
MDRPAAWLEFSTLHTHGVYNPPAMQDPDELSRALAELCATERVEVHEDGEFLAGLAPLRFEVQQKGSQLVLHLWSEERNLVRRVLRVAEHSDGHLLLEIQRFGRAKPGRLEFHVPDRARPAARMTRERFRARFKQLLAETFPDETVASLTSSLDLERSLSGSYARGLLRSGQRGWAVMGVSGGEDAATIDAILSFGLVWLDWQRERAQRIAVAGLRLFLPGGSSRITAHRLQALSENARVEIYEVDESAWRARRVDPADAGNLATWLTPRREVDETLHAADAVVRKAQALAPDAIDAVVPPGTCEVALRFRGLEFARWHNGQLHCGLPDERRLSGARGWPVVEKLVRELAAHRHADAAHAQHALYRAQAERWLETLALADPARIDAQLDPRHLYSQVPAFSAGDRGVMDLLGVTRDGRLAVIELKVSEDIHLALQAVDYWLRVRWHHRQGDFQRYGYFSGVELQVKPPRLLLVAPGLRFHPVTDTVLRYLSEEVEVVRIGLNENWRRGIEVVFRK